jgi:hypothetical protein
MPRLDGDWRDRAGGDGCDRQIAASGGEPVAGLRVVFVILSAKSLFAQRSADIPCPQSALAAGDLSAPRVRRLRRPFLHISGRFSSGSGADPAKAASLARS